MSRWIDYDAIDYRNDKLHDKSEEFLNGVIYMAQRIEVAPSIDICFCKECKRANHELSGVYCGISDVLMGEGGFCSIGEREGE